MTHVPKPYSYGRIAYLGSYRIYIINSSLCNFSFPRIASSRTGAPKNPFSGGGGSFLVFFWFFFGIFFGLGAPGGKKARQEATARKDRKEGRKEGGKKGRK